MVAFCSCSPSFSTTACYDPKPVLHSYASVKCLHNFVCVWRNSGSQLETRSPRSCEKMYLQKTRLMLAMLCYKHWIWYITVLNPFCSCSPHISCIRHQNCSNKEHELSRFV